MHSKQDSQTPGTYIVSGSEDGKIVFWDLQTRQIKYELDGLDGVVQAVAVSNFGCAVAAHADTQRSGIQLRDC